MESLQVGPQALALRGTSHTLCCGKWAQSCLGLASQRKDIILLGSVPALPWGCIYADGAGLLPASPLREASFGGFPPALL